MLKNKILSLVCSVAMIGTMVASFVSVHAETEKPQMVATVVEKVFDASLEGYPQYEVTVSLAGFSEVSALTNTGNAIKPKYNGNNILMTQGFMTYDDSKYVVMPDNTVKVKAEGTWTINADNPGQVNFLWNTTSRAEMIATPDVDLIKFYFVACDADFNPGEKLADNENIVSFVSGDATKSAKVDLATFNASTSYTTDISYSSELGTMINVAKPLKEEVVVTPSVDAAADEVQYAASTIPGKKTAGFATTVTPANGGAFNKITANIGNGSVNKDFVIYEGVSIKASTVFGLNITQVPADVTITVNSVKAE